MQPLLKIEVDSVMSGTAVVALVIFCGGVFAAITKSEPGDFANEHPGTAIFLIWILAWTIGYFIG